MRSRVRVLFSLLAALTAAAVAHADEQRPAAPPAAPAAPVAPVAPVSAASRASGDDPTHWLKELDVEAGRLEADLPLRELDLSEGVRVRLSPYYLRADRIHLSLSPWGVRVVGDGKLSFCPCDDPPLTIGFAGGWAAPPDELIVESPTLRFFGVPILWLPYLWLRSPRKVGLAIPEISWRGRDGLFFGEQLHLPLGEGLELGAGVYASGGFAGSLDFATTTTFTRARLDVRSDASVAGAGEGASAPSVPGGLGLSIDAWGALGQGALRFRWDVDAVRGPRAPRTLLALEPLARPFDRGVVEASAGPVAFGVAATSARAGSLERIDDLAPWAALGGGGSIGSIGAWGASMDAGPRFVRGAGGDLLLDGGARLALAGPTWPITWRSDLRLDARGGRPFAASADPPASAGAGSADGRGGALVGEARFEASLPLARALDVERARGGPPVLHVLEPLVRAAFVGALAEGPERLLVGFPAAAIFEPQSDAATVSGRRLGGTAAMGVRTSLGTLGGGVAPGRDPFVGAMRGELVAGGLALSARRDAILAGSFALDLHHGDGGGVDLRVDGALARAVDERDLGLAYALLGSARWSASRDGVGLELRGAARSELPPLGVLAVLGRDLAPWLSTPAWLARSGTTGGLSAVVPLGAGLAVSGGGDAFAPSLRALHLADVSVLDVHGAVRYAHPCGCFRVALRGAHVIGRGGLDLFATLELAQRAPEDPRNAPAW
jgi:hypothetical protein